MDPLPQTGRRRGAQGDGLGALVSDEIEFLSPPHQPGGPAALRTRHPHLTHPTTTCEKGPGKNRMHNYVKAGLAACLRAAGAEVDVERCIPDLSKVGPDGTIVDAIMDVVASFPNATRQYWFDVTV